MQPQAASAAAGRVAHAHAERHKLVVFAHVGHHVENLRRRAALSRRVAPPAACESCLLRRVRHRLALVEGLLACERRRELDERLMRLRRERRGSAQPCRAAKCKPPHGDRISRRPAHVSQQRPQYARRSVLRFAFLPRGCASLSSVAAPWTCDAALLTDDVTRRRTSARTRPNRLSVSRSRL